MNTLKAGSTYQGRFITNSDSTLDVRVIKRTAKTVSFKHPHHGVVTRAKVHQYDGVEFFYPMGQCSMALTIHADREV